MICLHDLNRLAGIIECNVYCAFFDLRVITIILIILLLFQIYFNRVRLSCHVYHKRIFDVRVVSFATLLSLLRLDS
jgi:ABC-type protease/lipase transport system fused ATPase/permease subunit